VTKRVAGVESGVLTSHSAPAPPARDTIQVRFPPERETPDFTVQTAAEAFGRHFLRCFFCHIGDRYTEDHFCEEGRELIVEMLDELVEA
jgi:hypothetical protein